jgi:hypothetical protein
MNVDKVMAIKAKIHNGFNLGKNILAYIQVINAPAT